MSTADQRIRPVTQQLAFSFSKLLTPAFVLALVVILAALKADLDFLSIAALFITIVVVPGVVHKKAGPILQRYGFSDRWRHTWVLLLTFTSTFFCFVLELPAPVPATMAALFFGNAGLVLIRHWLNASAHVSIMLFAVLWLLATHGIILTPLLILPPLMVVSRIILRQHSVQEALWGAFLGSTTFCCFLVVTIWS